jgi:hypothetical protein
MTQIESMTSKAGKTVGSMHHVKALIEGLDNRPQDFVYRGEILEGEGVYCACGHPIHFMFPIYDVKNEKNVKILGSTCITNYGEYRPDDAKLMQMKYEELLAKIAEAKRASKEAMAKEEIAKLSIEHTALKTQIRDRYENHYNKIGKFAPRALWYAVVHSDGCARKSSETICARYKKSGFMVRALKKSIEEMSVVKKELMMN